VKLNHPFRPTQPQRSHNVTTTVYTKQVDINDILNNFNNIMRAGARQAPMIIDEPYPESRKGLVYKAGKYTKKTITYFKKPESKASILVATWIVESIAYALTFLVLLSSGAVITAALWTALYAYISYAFFGMLKDAMILNSIKGY